MAIILIVDDYSINREFLVSLLSYGGHTLLEAVDGADALRVVIDKKPDLVIADVLMPTMDGYEFVRQLRANPAISETRVIFCTATYHEAEAQALARACNVLEVIVKPCEPERVLDAVDRALRVGDAQSVAMPSEDFGREHLRLMTDVLSQKADELEHSNSRLNALIELGLQLGSKRIIPALLDSFCQGARTIIGTRLALVGILRPNDITLRHFVTNGLDSDEMKSLGTPAARDGLLGDLLRGSSPRRVNHPSESLNALPLSLQVHQGFIACAIGSPSTNYGWLCLIDKIGGTEFTAEDERLAVILASQMGRVYENGFLYTDLVQHAAQLKQEISDRLKAEGALRQSDKQIRLLLDSTAESIYGVDLDGECTFSNRSCEVLLGYRNGEKLLGKNMHQLLHRDSSIEECSVCNVLVTSRRSHGEVERFYRADGTTFAAEFWAHPMFQDDLLIGAVVTFWDISEKRKLEEQFRQSQKMEAIGHLAGGIAHDFNNLLTIINGYADLLAKRIPQGESLGNFVDQIRVAGDRAAALTHQLLAFSRKQKLAPVKIDLNSLVADLSKMLTRIIGENIVLTIIPFDGLWSIEADRGQIEQVIMNLVVNARDAMPRGGDLVISTANVEFETPRILFQEEIASGDFVRLSIEDTGCGMDEVTKRHIFEPFFTTKGPEKGTGLGLATVFGIVRQSGGAIDVVSAVGEGSSFSIFLPRSESDQLKKIQALATVAVRCGHETILLVEDADGVRAFASLVLKELGYTILEARDPKEALDIFGTHHSLVDLVISDVVMPGMSGPELVIRLRELEPSLKVLFFSGFANDLVMQHGLMSSDTPFIEKPFSPESLAQIVRRVLDDADAVP